MLLVAGILHSARYLSAALFGSGLSNWNRSSFLAMLQYVGPSLAIGGYVALGVGVGYLLWGGTKWILIPRAADVGAV